MTTGITRCMSDVDPNGCANAATTRRDGYAVCPAHAVLVDTVVTAAEQRRHQDPNPWRTAALATWFILAGLLLVLMATFDIVHIAGRTALVWDF